MIKDQTAALNRRKTLTLARLKQQIQQHLNQLQAQIKAIDRERITILAANARLKVRSDILVSIPAFAATTAFALLIDRPELGSMSGRQGRKPYRPNPVTRQSGSWCGKSFIQGGRANLK